MYSLYQIFLYISAVISLVLIGIVFIKSKKINISVLFSCICLAFSLWLFSYAQIVDVSNISNALIFSKIGFVGVILIPFLIFIFLFSFIEIKINKIILFITILITLTFIYLLFNSNLLISAIADTSWGIYPRVNKLHFVFVIYSIILLCVPLIYLYKYIHKSEITSIKKQKIIYLLLISITYIFLFIFDNLFFYNFLSIEPISYLTALFYLFFLTFIILSFNFSSIKMLFIKAFVFVCILIFAIIITKYILLFSTNIYVTNFITFILAIGCFFIYRKIIEKSENIILSNNKHYQNLLIRAASGMAKEHNLDKLLKIIAMIVLKLMKINYIAIFLKNKDNDNYEIKIIRSFYDRINELIFSYDSNHPFVNYMVNKEDPFLFEEMPEYIANSIVLPFRPALIVPSFSQNIKGFMVLGEKINKDIYSKQDIEIFKMLSSQTNLAIQNCVFFEEYKQAQEKIFTAEKLASIGGLAEGVAHQIRNRLNQFSMIAGELKYEILDFTTNSKDTIKSDTKLLKLCDYLTQLSTSLSDNVKKTDDVVKGVLDYAKIEASQKLFEQFDIKEIISLSFDLLKTKHHISNNFKINLNIPTDSFIFAIKSQITEVIYNLMDNAYEAIEEKFNVLSKQERKYFVPAITISLEKQTKIDILTISDNGIGIKQENFQKIFVPFFTTKMASKSGTGIGMYIVKRMITESHGGKIELESNYMSGTKVVIKLNNKLLNS